MSAQPFPMFASSATISVDGRYRYDLHRCWDSSSTMLPFVMCNPSTADAAIDDPTIRRCIGFARRLGFGGIVVRNLFAWRATSPRDLAAARRAGEDIVGPDNPVWLAGLQRMTTPVVAAWGSLATLRSSTADRSATDAHIGEVVEMLGAWVFRLDDG
jgi:hypothetical protein